MTTDSTMVRRRKGRSSFWRFVWACSALVILHLVLYQTEPFPPFLNNLISNLVTVGVSILSAWLATLAVRRYEPTETPRRIWSQFALALWGWTIGEVIWAGYNMAAGEVPLSMADLFWVVSYGAFALALIAQYRLVFQADEIQLRKWISLLAGSTLVLTLILAWLLATWTGEEWGLTLLVIAFYPVGDLVIAVAALRLVHRFHGGALGYPWIGLFAFAFTDMLYGALEMSGLYTWSVSSGNFLSTVADVSYVAAYLFVAAGCYAQLLLLKHGPIFVSYRLRKGTA